MNHFNNASSCTHATMERIAFDLMLKIAESDTQFQAQHEVMTETNHQINPEVYTENKTKEYWLNLYTECLSTVKNKRKKK